MGISPTDSASEAPDGAKANDAEQPVQASSGLRQPSSLREWWVVFRKAEANHELLGETARQLAAERELLVRALRKWRKRAFQCAILARALAAQDHAEQGLTYALRATRGLLREVLRHGGHPPRKRRAAFRHVFLLLGETYGLLGKQDSADRHLAAAAFCEDAVPRSGSPQAGEQAKRGIADWLTDSPCIHSLPQMLGSAEAEWTRMQLWHGLRRAGIVLLVVAVAFAAGEAACHVLTERALDSLIEHASFGFLPGYEGRSFVPPEMKSVFVGHLGLLFLAALLPLWWLARSARVGLASLRFGGDAKAPKIAARANAIVSLCAAMGFVAFLGLKTNTFRTAISVARVLDASLPGQIDDQRRRLHDLSDRLDFPARNQWDNYLRVLLALHLERAGEYDAAVRLWGLTSRRAYFPMPSQMFVEYEIQVSRRLAATGGYERALVERPGDPGVLSDFGSYLLCHRRFASALDMLARSFEIDPRVAGLFEHTLSVPEAVDLLEKNTRHIVSSNDIGTDIAGGFLEAVAETSVLHRLGWAVREARGSAPPWAGRQIEETADKAVQRVAGACAAHRSDVTVQLNLAEFLSIVEDYQGADHIFSQVERLGGMYAKGYTTWGCTLYSLKKYGKACATFSKAAKLADPKSFVGDVLVKWGWSLARTGQREEAEKRFLAAVRQEEEEPKYHFQYGKAFAYWKEHEKAVAQFRKATDGPWPYRAAYAEWVHSLNELGRSKEAVELVCRAILFRPTKGALYSGVVYEALQKLPKQDYEAARNRIVEVVQGLRRSMDASWLPDIHLARCLARLGDPDLAARLLYRLELFMPWEDRLGWMTRSATEYVAWGEAYLEVGRPKAALEKFKSALRADPLNTEACRGLAQAYALSGEPAKAEETFKKIQQLGPAKPRVGSDGPGVE